PLDHAHAGAAHRDLALVVVPHVVEHQHHAARCESAQMDVALQQDYLRTIACGSQGGRQAGRPAADHHDVGLRNHRDVARRLLDHVADIAHLRFSGVRQCTFSGCQRTMTRSSTATIRKKPPDRQALIVIAEYSSAESKLNVALMISAPMPRVAPIHSPTTAPMTAIDAEMRSAENRYGSELNRRSLKKTSVLLADSTRISSIACGFTDSSPRTILTRLGKKHTSAAIAILGSTPLPMISTRIGALATTGMELSMSATGKKMSLSVRLWTNTVASAI